LPRILCDDPYLYYAQAAALLSDEERPSPGVDPHAVVETGAEVPASATVGPFCHIGRGARLGERVVVGPGCAIGERAQVGEDGRLGPSVTIYPRCVIGKRVVIHAGAVIGADGFGSIAAGGTRSGSQTGLRSDRDDVEIGANPSAPMTAPAVDHDAFADHASGIDRDRRAEASVLSTCARSPMAHPGPTTTRSPRRAPRRCGRRDDGRRRRDLGSCFDHGVRIDSRRRPLLVAQQRRRWA